MVFGYTPKVVKKTASKPKMAQKGAKKPGNQMIASHKIVDLNDDEEFQSLVREAMRDEQTGGKATNSNSLSSAAATISNPAAEKGVGFIWKVVGIVAFGIIILFSTDSIQIEKAAEGDGGLEGIPGHVEKKVPSGGEVPFPAPVDVGAVPVETPASAVIPPSKEPALNTPAAEVPVPVPASSEELPAPDSSIPEVPVPVPAGTTISTNIDRHLYKRRGQPMTDAVKNTMIKTYGSWTLVDDKQASRPQDDFYKQYPNRDVPFSKFPSNAWQKDNAYLAKFVPEALALTQRAIKAIHDEYGGNTEMFALKMYPDKFMGENGEEEKPGKEAGDAGGYTTPGSWKGLQRRLLHAILTEDSFVFGMAGHSAAAAHGCVSYHEEIFILSIPFPPFGSNCHSFLQKPLSTIIYTPGTVDFGSHLCSARRSPPGPQFRQWRHGNLATRASHVVHHGPRHRYAHVGFGHDGTRARGQGRLGPSSNTRRCQGSRALGFHGRGYQPSYPCRR